MAAPLLKTRVSISATLGRTGFALDNEPPYAMMDDVAVTWPDGTETSETMIAFGPALALLRPHLRRGAYLDLIIECDTGHLAVVDFAQPLAAAA